MTEIFQPFTETLRTKIKSINDLATISAGARQQGLRVVHAHGVFDLLHVGHIRHLEAARRLGDMLIVTVTADGFVNKGPGRPVFLDRLRCEMIAALSCVAYVAVNNSPSAETALKAIRPTIYVKGSDYANPDDDITGKITAERKLVESLGGHMVFTNEITFSSSHLMNKYLDLYEQPLQEHLEYLREKNALDYITKKCNEAANLKALIIGDAIIDEYKYVKPLGRPSKEPILATQFINGEKFAGGVIAAANHLASFCKSVDIITALGSENSEEELIRASLKPNTALHAIYRKEGPTTLKTRFVATGYDIRKLFEVYSMNDAPLEGAELAALNALIAEKIESYDLVVVNDFGHGLLGKSTIDLLCSKSRFLAVNTQANSGNYGYNVITRYPRADYICLDTNEARLATRENHIDINSIVFEQLPSMVACEKFIVTLGKRGAVAWDKKDGATEVPALTSTIVDTVGAGDAFFAVTAPFAALGVPMPILGFLGNAAGAIKVGIVGHRSSVERVPFLKFITALMK